MVKLRIDKLLASKKQYRSEYPDKNKPNKNEKVKENRILRKLVVFEHYSKGDIKCACCGETEYSFLCIDHIEGRKKFGHTAKHRSVVLYNWLIKNNLPKGFQVLCFNCNITKGIFGQCPHKSKSTKFIPY